MPLSCSWNAVHKHHKSFQMDYCIYLRIWQEELWDFLQQFLVFLDKHRPSDSQMHKRNVYLK